MNISKRYVAAVCATLGMLCAAASVTAQEQTERRDPRTARFMMLLDTNGDNKVTLDEIGAEQRRLIGAADVDGNGSLSVDEFRRRGRLFQRLGTTTLFDLLDVNGDQKLTAAEVSAPSRRWFTRYDADNDGSMVAEELPVRHGHRGRRGRH